MNGTVTDWGAAVMTSLTAALSLFLAAIPRVIGFLVILVIGWLISGVLAAAVAALRHFTGSRDTGTLVDAVGRQRVGRSRRSTEATTRAGSARRGSDRLRVLTKQA